MAERLGAHVPQEIRRRVLDAVRERVGPDRYAQYVKMYGEDGVLAAALTEMRLRREQVTPSGPPPPLVLAPPDLAAMAHAPPLPPEPGTGPTTGGPVMGAAAGMVAAGLLYLVGWGLVARAGYPPWYLAAAALDTALPALTLGWVCASSRRTAAPHAWIGFPTALGVYLFAATFGGIAGAIRWTMHAEGSTMGVVGPIWNSPFAILPACLLVLWLAAKARAFVQRGGAFRALVGGPFDALIGLATCVLAMAFLADAPLRTPWFTRDVSSVGAATDAHPLLVVVTTIGVVGFVLGTLLPPANVKPKPAEPKAEASTTSSMEWAPVLMVGLACVAFFAGWWGFDHLQKPTFGVLGGLGAGLLAGSCGVFVIWGMLGISFLADLLDATGLRGVCVGGGLIGAIAGTIAGALDMPAKETAVTVGEIVWGVYFCLVLVATWVKRIMPRV